MPKLSRHTAFLPHKLCATVTTYNMYIINEASQTRLFLIHTIQTIALQFVVP